MNFKNLTILTLFIANLSGCDPHRKSKCEWYLVPEPKHKHIVKPGWVSLCAKNYELGRQKCFFTAEYGVAENMLNKPFVYNEMEFENSEFPKPIQAIKPCVP